jgi:hypothetical protein
MPPSHALHFHHTSTFLSSLPLNLCGFLGDILGLPTTFPQQVLRDAVCEWWERRFCPLDVLDLYQHVIGEANAYRG